MFDKKKYMREYAKKRNEERLAAGLCLKCAAPSPGFKHCEVCRAKCLEQQNRLQSKKVAGGFCRKCSAPLDCHSKQLCSRCLARSNEQNRNHRVRNKDRGKCTVCGKDCVARGKCDECKVKGNQVIKSLRERRAANGLCRDCGQEAMLSNRTMRGQVRSDYCSMCYLKMLAKRALGAGQWQVLLDKLYRCDWKCVYTGKQLVLGDNLSFDHSDPVCRFPEKANDPDNVEPVDWQVNLLKRDLTKSEFLELVGLVYHHTGEGVR